MIAATKYIADSRNAYFLDSDNGAPSQLSDNLLQIIFKADKKELPISCLILLCDDVSVIVANIVDRQRLPIAQICGKTLYSNIYDDDLGNVIVETVSAVPEHLLLQWMKLLHSFNPSSVLAMSSSSLILSSSSKGSLRSLVTSDISCLLRNETKETGIKNAAAVVDGLKKIELLAPGIVVTGMLAAIMSFCEGRSISAVCIICCRRSAISFSALRSFESVLPLIHGMAGGSSPTIENVATASYKSFIMKCSFAATTENLYT